jgi:hypothetical protein
MANNERTATVYVMSRTMTRPKALQGRSATVPKEYMHEETIILSGIFFDLDLAEKTLEHERESANEYTSYALHKIVMSNDTRMGDLAITTINKTDRERD